MTQLLQESTLFGSPLIEFQDDKLLATGLYQLSGVVNRNKRIYTESLWDRHLSPSSDLVQRLKSRKVLGELAHPKSGLTSYKNVSHLILEIWKVPERVKGCEICESGGPKHSHIMGKEEVITETPDGKILEALFKRDIPVGISSRGSGSLKPGVNSNESIVQDDYKCETWDHVTNPSTPGSWTSAVNESVIEIVNSLADPSCDPHALNTYKMYLQNVFESSEQSSITRYQASKLIEDIDHKLSSPVCTRNSVSVPVPSLPEASACSCSDYPCQCDVKESTSEFGANKPKNTEAFMNQGSPELEALIQSRIQESTQALQNDLKLALSHIDQLADNKAELEEENSKLERAGDELLTQLRQSKFMNECLKSQYNEAYGTKSGKIEDNFSQKYNRALEVIEELVNRCKTYMVHERRSKVATKLLGEAALREQRKQLVDHVNALLSRENASLSESLRPRLLKCESIKDVNSMYGTVKQAVNESVSVNESRQVTPRRNSRRQEHLAPVNLNEGALPLSEDTQYSMVNEMPSPVVLDEQQDLSILLSSRIKGSKSGARLLS